MTRRLTYILLMLATMAPSCSSRQDRDLPVPRPAAYHRLSIPDSIYRSHNTGLVTIQLNSATTDTIVTAGNSWITSQYPGLGTSVYITVSELSPATAAKAIDNRIERISLNTGGHPTEVTSFTTPSNLDAQLIVTPVGTPTPVQFLATDHRSLLVSGTATVDLAATAPADSLSPIVGMLQRDMTHLLETLTRQ